MGSSMSSSNGVSHATGFGHTYGFGHGLFGQSYSHSHSHGQQFYFDSDMDSPHHHQRPDCCSTKSELRDKLESLADVTERIKEVRYYVTQHPLNTPQTSSRYAFVVLETDSWFWSIEKDDRGVTIQRSKYVENVRDNCRRQRRSAAGSGIEMAKKPSGYISVIELLNRFWMSDRVNVEIHFQTNNSSYQHFADILYDFV